MPEYESLESMLAELKEYRAIGTLQEFRELKADCFMFSSLQSNQITQGKHVFVYNGSVAIPTLFECIVDQISTDGDSFHSVNYQVHIDFWKTKSDIGRTVFYTEQEFLNLLREGLG